jgi:hypothetical protein
MTVLDVIEVFWFDCEDQDNDWRSLVSEIEEARKKNYSVPNAT